jgi:hypothetical protein
VHAFTVVFDRLIPDEERKYAGIAAESLAMPIHFLSADAYQPYDHWDDPTLCAPEPAHEPWAALNRDQTQQIANHSRVALTGVGADPLFGYHNRCGRHAEARPGVAPRRGDRELPRRPIGAGRPWASARRFAICGSGRHRRERCRHGCIRIS